MSNDLVQTNSGALAPANNAPFGSRALALPGGNVGAIAIESERAVAEAKGQMQLAKMFPRSLSAATTEFLDACKSEEFSKGAFYSVPNRGTGPSIRFAEEAARCYGNFEYGHRELSRGNGKSEVEVFAWDKEKNNRSIRQITVEHILDTKNGPRKLIDQADIDNRIANIASKQIRGRILALMPKHMILAGIAEAKKTLAGNNDKPLSARVIEMAGTFSKFGVTNKHLEKHLGHSVDDTTLDELADLRGIYNAIKEGAKASEYFSTSEDDKVATGAAITAAATQNAAAATPAATPAQAAERKPAATKRTQAQDSKPQQSESKQEKSQPPESDHKDAAGAPNVKQEQAQPDEGDVF